MGPDRSMSNDQRLMLSITPAAWAESNTLWIAVMSASEIGNARPASS